MGPDTTLSQAPALPRQPPAAEQRWSLRVRLLALALLLATAAWVVGGAVAVRAAADVAARMRDERLVQLASTVLVFARHELAEAAAEGESPQTDAERRAGLDLRYRYQVVRAGQVLMHSPDAPPDRPLALTWADGFASVVSGGTPMRAYVSAPDDAGLQVQVAELLDPAGDPPPWPGLPVLALMALSLALVGAGAAALVMRVLRPVAAAEAALRARPLQSLDPVPTRGLPDEMRPLLEALNEHLARSAERLSRESGFTALAAHELRTPLAALRMQLQVALRTADAARRDEQLRTMLASVDRCSHLIGQLLTLARVEQEAGLRRPVDLRALALQVIDELDGEKPGRAHAIELVGPALWVDGWDFALGVLLRNLLANALVHGAADGPVRVELARDGDEVVLCVDDAGAGIAPAQRAQAWERFVRLGAARSGGVGLGLSIVRAVADGHGARVELLDAPLGGLRVRVVFRAAADPAGNPDPAP